MSKNNYKQNRRSFNKISRGGETNNKQPKLEHEPIQAKPLEVKVFNNNFEKALKAFRALVQKERILSVYKDKQSYEKPSDKKRRKRNEMKRKRLELDYHKKNFKDKNYGDFE